MPEWKPFRPTTSELDEIAADVGDIHRIQQDLLVNHPDLKVPDRVAHQYQIAGSKVELTIASDLPENLLNIGLFVPGATHTGIGRVSMGLGCPHLETDPDFLGLMLAFATSDGHRVDFLGINHPGAPTDTHTQFMSLLSATAQAAGAEPPFGSGLGELDLFDLLAGNLKLVRSLVSSLGLKQGGSIVLHVLQQTLRMAFSSTAYQSYWTGVVEVGGTPCKFLFAPKSEENERRELTPGEHHLSEEWLQRQARGPVHFNLFYLPFVREDVTPLSDLTETWEVASQLVGEVVFPMTDGTSDQSRSWAALAAEMGANPGNWIHDPDNTISEPATEFTCARKIAYENSQTGRDVLPEEHYAHVFQEGTINDALHSELDRRRSRKRQSRHIDGPGNSTAL